MHTNTYIRTYKKTIHTDTYISNPSHTEKNIHSPIENRLSTNYQRERERERERERDLKCTIREDSTHHDLCYTYCGA